MKPTAIQYAVSIGVVAVALFLILGKSLAKQSQTRPSSESPTVNSKNPDANPDAPEPFGYKCVWYSVKTTNTDEVAKEIGIKAPVRCNWKSGIAAAYEGQVFVAPPVSGWTLIVCQDFATLDNPQRKKKAESLLSALSTKFGEAHHYATHRVVEFHAWAKAVGGKISREYAYLGEGGETLANVGEKTKEEAEAGVGTGVNYAPNEDTVMHVAGKWSLDPSKLNEQSGPPGVGWLGKF